MKESWEEKGKQNGTTTVVVGERKRGGGLGFNISWSYLRSQNKLDKRAFGKMRNRVSTSSHYSMNRVVMLMSSATIIHQHYSAPNKKLSLKKSILKDFHAELEKTQNCMWLHFTWFLLSRWFFANLIQTMNYSILFLVRIVWILDTSRYLISSFLGESLNSLD